MVTRDNRVTTTNVDAGSFRDRSGHVFLKNGRILRSVSPYAAEDFQFVRGSGLLDDLVRSKRLLPFQLVDPDILRDSGERPVHVLEHPRLDHVSYPYEWPFPVLKAAALLHLDIHLTALERGVNLSDASAYNIQFKGTEPVFIDHLSFRRYQEGEYWAAHRQFCESFLNPLLLRSECGVAPNDWYRGRLNGISVTDMSRLLPLKSKFSWNVLSHVVLQARFQKSGDQRSAERSLARRKLPLSALVRILEAMRKWIEKLQPTDTGNTVWQTYSQNSGYADDDFSTKAAVVTDFVKTMRPELVWDMGCNTGEFSKLALEAGARAVIGYDSDQGALENAYTRARVEGLNLLPLYLDVTNPPPDQGWDETERKGIFSRARADGVLALALVHHIAITHNVPLERVIDWLVKLAPAGVIEFVPKQDDMVKKLLSLRDDIFHDYSPELFIHHLRARARIARKETLPRSGRILVIYQRD